MRRYAVCAVFLTFTAACSSSDFVMPGDLPTAAATSAVTLPSTGPAVEPSQPSPSSDPDKPLTGVTIAIDAGHNPGNSTDEYRDTAQRPINAGGGITKPCDQTGTEGGGLTEAVFNMKVAKLLQAKLEARGAKVIMTRTDDDPYGPCIPERAERGNAADVALSIHADGAPADGHGFAMLVPEPVKNTVQEPIVDESIRLGTALRDAVKVSAGLPYSTYLGRDGLMPRKDLGGLNLSRIPKVFIEVGNMKNPGDIKFLKSPDGQEKIAEALAHGFQVYLGK